MQQNYALMNPVSSAYLRLVPNQEAPTRICWSDQNRSAINIRLLQSTIPLECIDQASSHGEI